MKRILFLLSVLALSIPSYAQWLNMKTKPAYSQHKVQSREDYEYEKSERYTPRTSYDSYTGPRTFVSCRFRTSDYTEAYVLYSNGRIYDNRNGNGYGHYFVGEEMYYKCNKVYIRWDHGGESTGSLNYKERSDGKPVFRIKIGAYTKYYHPF